MTEPTRVRVTGPLAPYQVGWCAELDRLGYTPGSAAGQVRLMARLSRWLAREGLDTPQLTSERAEQFLLASRGEARAEVVGRRSLGRLLGYLRLIEVVPTPTPKPATPVDELLGRFSIYLASERGLAAGTVGGYERTARGLLAEFAVAGVDDLANLGITDVTRVVVDLCHRHRLASPNNIVAALRSLLRFLFAEGITTVQLASAVRRSPAGSWLPFPARSTLRWSPGSLVAVTRQRDLSARLRDLGPAHTPGLARRRGGGLGPR